MAEPADDAKRFSELLPFYVNQTLEPTDQAWMEQQLSLQPHARQALALESLIRHAVRNTRSPLPESERLAHMLGALRKERHSHKGRSPVSWLGLSGWSRGLAWGARLAIPVPAALVLFVVLLGQAVYIARSQLPEAHNNLYRGVVLPCAAETSLRLQFKPSAKMEDTLLLLRKAGVHLSAGPTETGEVWVSVASGLAEEAHAVLKASSLVVDAQVLPVAPPSQGCQTP